jgi:hypothetical protein
MLKCIYSNSLLDVKSDTERKSIDRFAEKRNDLSVKKIEMKIKRKLHNEIPNLLKSYQSLVQCQAF